jgi:hypothetical protein
MAANVSFGAPTREPGPPARQRITLGVLVGGGVLLAVMFLIAGLAVLFGWIPYDAEGRLQLGTWLMLEILGGGAASVLAGWVCRRIARDRRGPLVLAAAMFTIGLLEATEIRRHVLAGRADAPMWLVGLAPVVAAVGILIGGWRRSRRAAALSLRQRTRRLMPVVRYATCVLAVGAAAVLSILVLPELQPGPRTTVVASALTLDFTVTGPALVYVLLVRARRLPWMALIPTFVVGYALALATIPEQHHAFLEGMRLVIIPAELALVTYLVVLTRRAFINPMPWGAGDFVTRFRSAARSVLESRVPADIFATEIGLLYHAFRHRARSTESPRVFTMHRETGYGSVVIGLAMAILVETVALHVLVSQWSGIVAWILTGLSIYALVWLLGDYRAFGARPTQITSTHLHLRAGMRWEADIPLDQIVSAESLVPDHGQPPREALVAVVLGGPNVRLKLKSPVEVIGMYGLRKTVTEIWLQADESTRLCQALVGP